MNLDGSWGIIYFLLFIIVLFVPLVLYKNNKILNTYDVPNPTSSTFWICFAVCILFILSIPVACGMICYKFIKLDDLEKKLQRNPLVRNKKIEGNLSSDELIKLEDLRSYITNLQPLTMIDEEHLDFINQLHERNDEMSSYVNKLIMKVFETNAIKILEDEDITDEKESFMNEFLQKTQLAHTQELMSNRYYLNFVQGLCLKEIKEGKPVDRIKVDEMPVLLQKEENLLWAYQNVTAYEEKTGRKYQGGSRGYSMRVFKGVYYRVGASNGHSVSYQYKDDMGKGFLILTDKNIIFSGAKSVKIPLKKILSITPYSDGIEIVKDGANARPYTFAHFDPWFVINAIRLLV